jgi:hypothetical protein
MKTISNPLTDGAKAVLVTIMKNGAQLVTSRLPGVLSALEQAKRERRDYHGIAGFVITATRPRYNAKGKKLKTYETEVLVLNARAELDPRHNFGLQLPTTNK